MKPCDKSWQHTRPAASAFYEVRQKAVVDGLLRAGEAQGNEITPEVALERWRFFERERYLRSVDTLWKHHLKIMDSLRQGVHLEAYGQKDPKLVYKKEGYELFQLMSGKVQENVTEVVFRAEGPSEEEIERMRQKRLEEEQKLMLGRGGAGGGAAADKPPAPGEGRVVHQGSTFRRKGLKVGRNEPCPCGSGKKFKKCHEGQEEELWALLGSRSA